MMSDPFYLFIRDMTIVVGDPLKITDMTFKNNRMYFCYDGVGFFRLGNVTMETESCSQTDLSRELDQKISELRKQYQTNQTDPIFRIRKI